MKLDDKNPTSMNNQIYFKKRDINREIAEFK